MKQKFFRGQRVHIKNSPPNETHFISNVDAIVRYSYSDVYGSDDTEDFSLLILENEPYSLSWVDETRLTLVDDDRVRGEEILQEHREE